MKTETKLGNWILRSIHHVRHFADMRWVPMPTDRIVGMVNAGGDGGDSQYITESWSAFAASCVI